MELRQGRWTGGRRAGSRTGRMVTALAPWALALPLLLASGPAWGQVAAPELYPGPPRFLVTTFTTDFYGLTLTPDNPAVQQWQRGGKIAIGRTKLEGVYNPAVGTPQYLLAGEGNYGGLSWIGERSGLSVESLTYRANWSDGTPGETRRASGAALSAMPFDWLTVGFGTEKTHLGSAALSRQRKTGIAGVSTCFGVFCLGYADTTTEFSSPTDPTFTGKGKGNLWGLGLQGGEEVRWHLEYARTDKKDVLNAFGIYPEPGYTLGQQVLEFNVYGWLLAYRGYTTHLKANHNTDGDGWTASFGWAPPEGLSIVGTLERGQWAAAGLNSVEERHGALTLGWGW